MWEHGEESLGKFLNKFKAFNSTIKFTADFSQETIDFLCLNLRLVDGKLMIDLFDKPTNAQQPLDTSSSHSYHCKKDMRYSQALRINRICSDNESFDKRCNNFKTIVDGKKI